MREQRSGTSQQLRFFHHMNFGAVLIFSEEVPYHLSMGVDVDEYFVNIEAVK